MYYFCISWFSLWLVLPPRTPFLATRQGRKLEASATINVNAALLPVRTWTSVFLWSLNSAGYNTNISQYTMQSYLSLLLGIVHFKTISLSWIGLQLTDIVSMKLLFHVKENILREATNKSIEWSIRTYIEINSTEILS